MRGLPAGLPAGPVTGPVTGPAYLLRGLAQWRTRPRVMALGLLPALLVLVLLAAALALLAVGVDDLVVWATPFADGWADVARRLVRVVLAVAVVLGALVTAGLVFTGLTLAVGDPFYERVWRATEEALGDPPQGDGLSWWRSARDGLTLALTGLGVGVVLLVAGLLPVVGAVLGLVGGLAASGWLLAGELLARPLEARGLDRRARRALLRRRRGAVWGFGIATQVCFLVPGGAVVVMSAAVAGATMLARELLDEPGPARRTPQPVRPDSA